MILFRKIFLQSKLGVVFICLMVSACADSQTYNFLPFLNELFSRDEETKVSSKPSGNVFDTENGQADLIEVVHDSLSSNEFEKSSIVNEWTSEGAVWRGNIKGTSLTQIIASNKVGEGNDWQEGTIAASPVAVGNIAVAMDGAGYISAHKLGNLEPYWQNDAIGGDEAIASGGLAIDQGIIFAVTSNGKMAAINLKTGKKLWRINLREPVRSALRIEADKLYLVTADSQLLAFNAGTGEALWQYRSVAGGEGVFSTSTPAISDDGLIAASFPSGDVVVLEAVTGEQIWSDRLTVDSATEFSKFDGVEANPIIVDGMLIVGGISDRIIAYDLRNGIKLWEIKTGLSHTPWVSGDALYFVNDKAQLIAVNKINGLAAWKVNLKLTSNDEESLLRYQGVFVTNDKVVVVREDGLVMAFAPQNGKRLLLKELNEDIASAPAFINDYGLVQSYSSDLLLLK
jgi:outer membrane protein assembly factor BamB